MVWNFVLNDIITQAAVPEQEDHSARSEINAPTNETFKIADTKLQCTLSLKNRKKQLLDFYKMLQLLFDLV